MNKASYLITPIILFLLSYSLNGQNPVKITNECDCKVVFQDLVNKLEKNYIGLRQKQITNTAKDYEERKQIFEQKSIAVSPENCAEFLDEFLNYFDDGHLHVIERPNYSESELNEYKKSIKEDMLKQDSLNQDIQLGYDTKIDQAKDLIIGNWTDGVSRFIVLKAKDEYHAYIAETSKESIEAGELKAIFKPKDNGYTLRYYSYNYGPVYTRGEIYKNGQLLRAGHVFWKKVKPTYSIPIDEVVDFKKPRLDIINTKTTLLTIPSFEHDFNYFKEFIEENQLYIKNSRNLIIDIRGNRGGNGVYFDLIELFATQNMSGSQGLVLASDDNLAYFERQMQYSKRVYKPVVQRIKNNMGKIVDGPQYPEKKFRISDNLIENVAILTDHGSASASESFILHSKRASSKVKTFGTPTAGMIDYTSVNSLLLNSGKQNILLAYPTSTLHKFIPNQGFNQTGIVPDVQLNEYMNDPIKYITDYFNNN